MISSPLATLHVSLQSNSPFSSKNIQQCRCGAPSCRGVLGPKPRDPFSNKPKETKDALAPIVNIGTKRKLQQAYEDNAGLMPRKKRRMTLPKTTTTSFETVKRRITTYRAEVKVLDASETTHLTLVKRMSERSLRRPRPVHTPGKRNRQPSSSGPAICLKR